MNQTQTSPGDAVAHPIYLPFTWAQFANHFAIEPGKPAFAQMAPYRRSIERYEAFCAGGPPPPGPIGTVKGPAQIEKDERVWIAAGLMAYYYAEHRGERLTALLTRALGEAPPFGDPELPTWADCFTAETRLYFEARLPSPPVYKERLREELERRHVVPYVLRAAEIQKNLEGPTHVDALLFDPTTGCSVLFEAKVLSDASCHVSFDGMRNQIARNIDVMLEPAAANGVLAGRRPERSAFVLVTPRLFQERPRSRLYGWLLDAYRNDPDALREDLPHREVDWEALSKRIGWVTFEDCDEVLPGACPWLRPAG